MKLYEIEAHYRELAAELEEAETPDSVYRTLDHLRAEREEKLAAICTLIKEARYEAEALTTEAKAMKARAESADGLAEKLIRYLQLCITPGEKWKDGHHAISWRASEGIVIFDESLIPDSCWTTPAPEVSKAKIKDAIKSGETIPGAKLEKRNNIQVK